MFSLRPIANNINYSNSYFFKTHIFCIRKKKIGLMLTFHLSVSIIMNLTKIKLVKWLQFIYTSTV